MYPETLKFSKLKIFKDIDFKFDILKKSDSKSLKCQILAGLIQKKDKSLLLFTYIIKEYITRVKLKKEISALCQLQVSVSHYLSKLRNKFQLRRKEKQNKESNRELLKNVISLYETNLGLRIEPASGNIPIKDEESAIRFVFNNIIENNAQAACSFILISDDSKYKVFNCHPPINKIEELLSNLNKTDNLCSFTVNIRKCFVNWLNKNAVEN